MAKVVVGVSGINAVDNPGPGIGVARSLREDPELDVEIVGLAYDAMEPGIYMDWIVDRSYLMPYPTGGGEAYIDRLLYIKEQRGLDCVIPNLDAELPLYIKSADILAEHGIATFLPGMEQFRLRGKDKLEDVAVATGLELPQTEVVTGLDTLIKAIEKIGLPVMIKGAFYKAHRAHTQAEAIGYYHQLVAEWGYPIIVQQVVSGDELNVVGLGDGEGNSLGLVGVKKLWITAQGKIWTGVTMRNEPMLRAAEQFVRSFRWRGPFELECIVSGDDVYLIEINPRFPAWSYLATGVGVNLPSQLVRRMMKMPAIPVPEYQAGKLFVRYSYELVTEMTAFQKIITQGENP